MLSVPTVSLVRSAAAGPTAGFDPVLISLIRRSMPNLLAYDLCGVQPMNGPTGLIFAMRSRYNGQSGGEAFFDEANSAFSAQREGNDATAGWTSTNAGFGTTGSRLVLILPFSVPPTLTRVSTLLVRVCVRTRQKVSESLETTSTRWIFSIEKVTVTAKSRALKAEYSLELAQDLKAIHGLNAEAELANILSSEILAEINREVIRTIYKVARSGAQNNVATAGTFDLDVDSNGRWSVEKFKGLLFQIERDANAIAQETRRGKGNTIITSADVASALTMAGVLDYTPALNANLNVDDTGNTFAGTINGKYRVYIDPYSDLTSLPTTTTLLVTRVLPLMTLDSSTAHTFPCRWSVPLTMAPSNPKLASRPATAWSRTHSQKELLKVPCGSPRTLTATIVVLRSPTSCDLNTSVRVKEVEGSSDPSFFI